MNTMSFYSKRGSSLYHFKNHKFPSHKNYISTTWYNWNNCHKLRILFMTFHLCISSLSFNLLYYQIPRPLIHNPLNNLTQIIDRSVKENLCGEQKITVLEKKMSNWTTNYNPKYQILATQIESLKKSKQASKSKDSFKNSGNDSVEDWDNNHKICTYFQEDDWPGYFLHLCFKSPYLSILWHHKP